MLPEKLTVPHLVKKYPAFYGTRKFIIALTNGRQLSIYWARSIQCMLSHPPSWRSTILLTCLLSLGLPSALLPLGFPSQNPVCTSSLPPYVPHAALNSFFWIWSLGQYLVKIEVVKLLILQSSRLPCRLVPLRAKYSSQYPILKHPHPVFLPHCERPSFTPTQNNKLISAVYLNLHTDYQELIILVQKRIIRFLQALTILICSR